MHLFIDLKSALFDHNFKRSVELGISVTWPRDVKCVYVVSVGDLTWLHQHLVQRRSPPKSGRQANVVLLCNNTIILLLPLSILVLVLHTLYVIRSRDLGIPKSRRVEFPGSSMVLFWLQTRLLCFLITKHMWHLETNVTSWNIM